MNTQIRSGAYSLLGVLIGLTLLLGYPGVNRSKARSREAKLTASVATRVVGIDEKVFTSPPGGLKTWNVFNEWHNDRSNCSRFHPESSSGPRDDVPPGQVLVGYINHFEGGSGPFPCEENSKDIYRGAIRFDLPELVKGAPVLSADKATLRFKVVEGGVAAYDGERRPITRVCEDRLFVADADWLKGFAGGEPRLPGGELIKNIKECPSVGCSIDVTKLVSDWIAGKKDKQGFVIVGENEDWLDKLIPHDNSVCQTRYGDFTLTVNYNSPVYAPEPTHTPMPTGSARINFALASNGASATAQNYTQDDFIPGLHFNPSYAIDGVRHTTPAGGNYWRDEHGLPSWLQVDFDGEKTIDEVALITVQIPGYETGADPTETQTTSQGVTAFDVLFWTGKEWKPVSAGTITGNSLAWKRVRFPFSPVTTSKIRVVVNVGFNSTDGIARIVELEAWGRAPKKFGGT